MNYKINKELIKSNNISGNKWNTIQTEDYKIDYKYLDDYLVFIKVLCKYKENIQITLPFYTKKLNVGIANGAGNTIIKWYMNPNTNYIGLSGSKTSESYDINTILILN